MKWGILATGNIAKKFASTINQMSNENEQLAALVGKPVCTCLAQTFLQRNGVIRLALFETPMQEVSGLKALTPADEQRCLAQFDLLPEEGHADTP